MTGLQNGFSTSCHGSPTADESRYRPRSCAFSQRISRPPSSARRTRQASCSRYGTRTYADKTLAAEPRKLGHTPQDLSSFSKGVYEIRRIARHVKSIIVRAWLVCDSQVRLAAFMRSHVINRSRKSSDIATSRFGIKTNPVRPTSIAFFRSSTYSTQRIRLHDEYGHEVPLLVSNAVPLWHWFDRRSCRMPCRLRRPGSTSGGGLGTGSGSTTDRSITRMDGFSRIVHDLGERQIQ